MKHFDLEELNLVVDYVCPNCDLQQNPIVTYIENPIVCIGCANSEVCSLESLTY